MAGKKGGRCIDWRSSGHLSRVLLHSKSESKRYANWSVPLDATGNLCMFVMPTVHISSTPHYIEKSKVPSTVTF